MTNLENSWYLTLESEDSDFIKYYCFCSCGKELKFYSKHNIKCSSCDNAYFINVKDILNQKAIDFQNIFSWKYETFENESGWHVRYFYYIPIFLNSEKYLLKRKKHLLQCL